MPEEKDFELSPRIEELQEKLAKDPKSRIFLKLAEEYRKSGMPEEAIEVCKEGLKNHPTYISAKVTLGKAYLDLKKVDDAQIIFEEVIEQASDNLMANRSLGDIYYMKGYAEEALKHYKIINMFNPNDQMVIDRIKELSEQMAEPEPITMETEISEEEEAGEAEAAEGEEIETPEVEIEAPVVEEPVEEEAVAEEGAAEEEEAIPAVEIDLTAEETTEEEEIPAIEIDLTAEIEEEPEATAEIVIEEKTPAAEEPQVVPEQKEEEALPAIEVEKGKEKETAEFEIPQVEKKIEPTGETVEKEAEAAVEAPEPEKKEIASITIAELYEKQGLIDKAIETYQQLLLKDPDNIEIKTRIQALTIKKEQSEAKITQERQKETIEEAPEIKEEAKEAKPQPLDKKKKEKIDTLNKWLDNINKLK